VQGIFFFISCFYICMYFCQTCD